MTKLAWGDEDPRVRRVVQQVLDQLVLGKGLRRDKNGKIELAVGDRSPFYFEGSDLQLRAADGLVVSPGSPTALRVDSIESSKVRDAGASSTSVSTSLRRITAAIATINATLATLGGGGSTWTETEIDFGSTPVAGKAFTVTDAAVSGTSKVMVVPSGNAPTDGYADVWEWDTIQFAATPGAGEFTLHAAVANGTTNGKRKVLYQVT